MEDSAFWFIVSNIYWAGAMSAKSDGGDVHCAVLAVVAAVIGFTVR